jgi:hypothetical protein
VSLPHLVEGFCAQNGVAREVRLELAFSRYEVYEGKVREAHRPKGLPAYAAVAREYVRMLQPLWGRFMPRVGLSHCKILFPPS